MLLAAALAAGSSSPAAGAGEEPVVAGSIIDLEGTARTTGRSLRRGLHVALRPAVSASAVRLRVLSDGYIWERSIEQLRVLATSEPVALLANLGTLTTDAVLPLLDVLELPLVGPHSGALFLRQGDVPVVNLRASYADEARTVFEAAHAAGVDANRICAMFGNTAIGFAVVTGLHAAAHRVAPDGDSARALGAVVAQLGADDSLDALDGPLPVARTEYGRAPFARAMGGLDRWAEAVGAPCQLVLYAGRFADASRLLDYLRYRGSSAVLALLSRADSPRLAPELRGAGSPDRVLLSRVMPVYSDAGVVRSARTALGQEMDAGALEGYLVGRLFLHMLDETRRRGARPDDPGALLASVRGKRIDLDGLALDFRDDNQGLDLVTLTHLTDDGWHPVVDDTWHRWLK